MLTVDMASQYYGSRDNFSKLSAQIQEKFRANQQTLEIYEKKNQWRAEMEAIVRTLHPRCRLVLSGSSANGFGSIHSDIDLVLCFEGSTVTSPTMLRRIDSLFTQNPRRFQTEVKLDVLAPIKLCH